MTWDKHRVLRLRKSLDLTQAEFAEALGCRQQTVSEWELGLYEPANAYARLLEQVESQKVLSAPLLHQINRNSRIPKTQKSLPQKSLKISIPDEIKDFEMPFDKPFDPAID